MGVQESEAAEFKLQPMKCELNFLSKSDGSAILSQGETVALVSVNGPQEIKTSSQSIEKSTMEVLFSGKGGKPSVGDRFKENAIRQTVDTAVLGCLYPRTGITITVQELEDFGGLIACSVNCVCLALLNSGVAMSCVFAAVHCVVTSSGNIAVNPTRSDADGCLAEMTFVFDSRDKSLVTSVSEGSYSEVALREALERCREASDAIFGFYRDIVKRYSSRI